MKFAKKNPLNFPIATQKYAFLQRIRQLRFKFMRGEIFEVRLFDFFLNF